MTPFTGVIFCKRIHENYFFVTPVVAFSGARNVGVETVFARDGDIYKPARYLTVLLKKSTINKGNL